MSVIIHRISITLDKIISLHIFKPIFQFIMIVIYSSVQDCNFDSYAFVVWVYKLGVDPIHFGVLFVVTAEIGFLTPPFGANLFVGMKIAKISLEKILTSLETLEPGATFPVLLLLQRLPLDLDAGDDLPFLVEISPKPSPHPLLQVAESADLAFVTGR